MDIENTELDDVISTAVKPPTEVPSDLTTINGWDHDTILYVKKIGDLSGAYNWIHNNTSFWYSVIDYIFKIILTAVQAPIAVGIFTTIDPNGDNLYIKIAIGTISIISFFIGGLYIKLGMTSKIQDLTSAATRFSGLFSKVRNELIKNDEDRRDAIEFIGEIEDEFEEYYSAAPACWSLVAKRYLFSVRGKADIEYAELFGIREIQIRRRRKKLNPEYEENKPKLKFKFPNLGASKSEKEDEIESPQTSNQYDTPDKSGSPRTTTPRRTESPRKNITHKVKNIIGVDLLKMNKAQKQYQLDRHFIDDVY